MSEENEQEQEQSEEVEVSDEQALQAAGQYLTDSGVTDQTNEENLVRLFNLYNQNHTVAQSYHEKVKKGDITGDVRSEIKKQLENVPVSEFVPVLGNDILDNVYTFLEDNPDQVIHVLNTVSEIVKYLVDTRDFQYAVGIEQVKKEQGIEFTPDETAEEAKIRCQAIRAMLTTLLKISSLLNKPIPPSIPVKQAKQGILPDLPGLPKTRTGASNLGRGAKQRRVKYSWRPVGEDTFTELREGILSNEIANKVISTTTYRITNSDLMGRFKPKGSVDQFSETPWELEFETGTLRGYVPSN